MNVANQMFMITGLQLNGTLLADGQPSKNKCIDNGVDLDRGILGCRPDLCLNGTGVYSAPDCRNYIRCTGGFAEVGHCLGGMVFDPAGRRCDLPEKNPIANADRRISRAMEYLYILALFGISSALAYDQQNCRGSHVECGPSGNPVWQQLAQLFLAELSDPDNFDGGITLMAACRRIQARTKCVWDYEERCSSGPLSALTSEAKTDLLMANVCDVPDLTEKAIVLIKCLDMAKGKNQDVCRLKAMKATQATAADVLSNHKSTDRSTKKIICCLFQNMAACHRPIFQEKCTGPFMATLVARMGGHEPVAVLDNLIEEIFKIYNCNKDVLASCPQSTRISDEDAPTNKVENVDAEDGETIGGDEESTEAESCDVVKCVTPIMEALNLAFELATSQLQLEIGGEIGPVSFNKNLTKKVCKKVQSSVTCFANYFANCMTLNIPYLQTLINNVLAALEACDRPDFYDNLEIFLSCQAKGLEFDRCQARAQQMQLAMAGLQSNPSVVASLVTDNMRGIRRMVCCTTQELTDCFNEAYKFTCPSRAVSDLWLSFKDSLMDILQCQSDVMDTCPDNVLTEWKALSGGEGNKNEYRRSRSSEL
ncbi:hypothetical protein BV898_14985 [Hypsibius exemplaris]|uniref:Chitin-binding type-2 domain-containing protein n=1 Tax=Hypsibius exemplaris TaxID=2072580 RepID=A0A9X6NH13_HYPEX|nr:hypothetical protein BV898_14985 [Hypsibius exemplaris]